MKTKLDHWLSANEAKTFIYVKERAHIAARYHQAIFYQFVPRFWAVNYGTDEHNKLDISAWFRNNNLPGLGQLAKEDAEGLLAASDDDQAIARRAVIFAIDERLYNQGHQGASDTAAIEQWRMDMQNATPLP